MKIIMFYINQIYEGGAERVIVYLANWFAQEGYDSILITSVFHEREYFVSEKVRRIILEPEEKNNGRIKKNIIRIKKLRKYLKTFTPDILVSFMTEPIVRSFIASIGLQHKHIISVRIDPKGGYEKGIGWVIGKMLFPFADGCVFQTEDAKSWFPHRLQEKSTIIINPVDECFFMRKRTPIRGRIITCGRLMPIKNQAMLIEAFAEVHQKIPETSLEIYGEGLLRENLQSMIRELQMEDWVSLKGQCKNVDEVLTTAELFVLTSNEEGMPNALLEALAVGVPCISTDCPCGGPAMVIENGVNGILINVGDTKMLTEKMIALLEDKRKARSMGNEARRRAEVFSSKKIFREWEEYIKHIAMGDSTC